MKLSKEALSEILKIFSRVFKDNKRAKPSDQWQDKVMNDIRNLPSRPAGFFSVKKFLTVLVIILAGLILFFVTQQFLSK